ncbi:hypothetical protein HU200_031242 [Digitaria exilis]|uniref:DUF4378 domain-containing protein n=1 Tax=Digitaria exilis TaxID=1010633 RepID=A0A835BQD7_9POAL|nr:hypothetical protein HU200_031242 [Digitaria exilis]
MAQLLHHQDSAFYGKELHGCQPWGILQFFGFRRRLRSTKMLSDKKHGQEKSIGGSRRRSSYAPLKNEDMDDKKTTVVTKKQKASKKNSGKTSLRSLILRKLYGKEGQKEKMLPVAPKLLRTISIHYLESNEYVLNGESSSSGDGSSHGAKLGMHNVTDTILRHSTSSIPDSYDSSLLLRRDDGRVKRKSHRSISMDGVLHKVPYGKKVSEDPISEGLPRSASATYDRDGLKPYSGPAAKRHVNQDFRRSRSLSESLENYSRLLDAISTSDSKRILTSSKSTRDNFLDVPGVMTSSQRASEVEFRSQYLGRNDENLVTGEDALAALAQEKIDVDGDAKVVVDYSSGDVVAGDSENDVLLEEYISEKQFNATVSVEDSCIVPSPLEVGTSEEQAATIDKNDQIRSSAEVELCADHSMSEEVDILEEHAETCDDAQIHCSPQEDSVSEDTNIGEEQSPTSHDNQMQSFQIPKSTKGTCVPDPSHEFEGLSCERESESPISVLDVAFSDDPASPMKHTPLDDTSLKPRILHLDADVSDDTDIVKESDFDDLNGFQVDPSHEVEFNYVKDIFKKSSFTHEALLDEWYSQNITALQEEDCQHYEAAAASFYFTDMSADQLLLFDLTNEALLDIYKKYSFAKSKFFGFSSSGRQKPVGHHVLEELWSRVSSRLDERPKSSIQVDMILSKDLAKSNRWTNFDRYADHMGNILADFVFDKLLTEVVLQLAEF